MHKMKKSILKYLTAFLLVLSFTLPLTSCVVHTPQHHRERPHKKHAPGHQKKIYGDRSAKRHAPGQQKKKPTHKKQKSQSKHKGGHKGSHKGGHRR